jgi:CMP-N-acetylneuraminic acid synthetase
VPTLGLIPARIGSSGVKRKNIRPLAGRPLIAWTIAAARASRLDRIVVSTDSPEIAAIARDHGAEVPFLRPPELADSTAIAMAVVRHAAAWLDDHDSWRADAIAYLQPTSPLRATRHIDAALALLTPAVDSVLSVVAADQHPLYMFAPTADSGMREYLPDAAKPERRQDLPPLYCSNPVVMLSWTRYLLAPGHERALVVNHKNFTPLVIDRLDAVDINDERDFRFADALMRERIAAQRSMPGPLRREQAAV